MKKHMVNSLGDRLNDLMINLILLLREMLSVRSKISTENINRMLSWGTPEISRRLKISGTIINRMHQYHDELDTLLYRNSQTDILSGEKIQILSSLARAMTHFINENKYHKNRHMSAKYMETIMSKILDWLDIDTVAALSINRHLLGTPDETQNEKNKKMKKSSIFS